MASDTARRLGVVASVAVRRLIIADHVDLLGPVENGDGSIVQRLGSRQFPRECPYPTCASTCFGSKLRLLIVTLIVSAAEQTSDAACTNTKEADNR
jgi:hypothetical protein